MYNSCVELEVAYPLGTIISEEPVEHRFYCSSDIVREKINDYYGEKNVKQVSPHHVVATNLNIKTIDGYMTDGTYWYPMIRNGRQWEVYCPDE